MEIPKYLYFVWIGDPMPDWLGYNLARWKQINPKYAIKVCGEEILLPRYRKLYDRIKDKCSKTDLLRLSALKRSGGWYFDTDFVPLRPIDEIGKKYDLSCGCFLTKQWMEGPKRINNGVIGITKDALAWAALDEGVEVHSERALERTSFGPLLATRVVNRCPDVETSVVEDFYPIPFSPVGGALIAYKNLLKARFDEKAGRQLFKGKNPFAFHLWCGGKEYDSDKLNRLSRGLT